jgi:disulfide bond formation protein DsbB
MLQKFIASFFRIPAAAGFALIFIAVFSLGFALISQYRFGLAPCVLCIYQRWPYVVVGVLGLIIMVALRNKPKLAAAFMALAAITFFTNMGIATFHVGVEQKWWAGLKTCSQPDFLGQDMSLEELEAMIMAAPVVTCGDIPWSLFGLSMAAYNVILSFIYGIYSLLAAVFITRKANGF